MWSRGSGRSKLDRELNDIAVRDGDGDGDDDDDGAAGVGPDRAEGARAAAAAAPRSVRWAASIARLVRAIVSGCGSMMVGRQCVAD